MVIGNMKVIVTGEISDNLRLMPRFADEEQQQASLVKDTLFGTSSIEGDPPPTVYAYI